MFNTLFSNTLCFKSDFLDKTCHALKTFRESGDSPEPDGSEVLVSLCVSFVPKKGTPDPVWMLCRRGKYLQECHHGFSGVTILTDPTGLLLLMR
jgi:hypothetical protein